MHVYPRGAGATTQQVSKRLQSELMTLMMSGDKVRGVKDVKYVKEVKEANEVKDSDTSYSNQPLPRESQPSLTATTCSPG